MTAQNDPRILFAAERTLLAWNRTSLSFIAFGFLVERAGLLIWAIAPQSIHAAQMTATFWLGLSFMALGSVTAACSALQYLKVLGTRPPAQFPAGYTARWGVPVSLVVALLGVVLMVAIWSWRPA